MTSRVAEVPSAALLDRDGTLIVDRHYLADPDGVELLPGAAEAIRLLAAAGVPAVVCTNQSGIGRGLISLERYHAVRRRLDALLLAEGAVLTDSFACPHHPESTGPCECRKPASGLYRRAAAVHGFALERAIYVGDKLRDILPALETGAAGALVRSPETTAEDMAKAVAHGFTVVDSTLEAVRAALGIAPGAA